MHDRIRRLERQQRRRRQEIFTVEDEIEKRDALIGQPGRRLTQATETERLFTIRWRVV